MIELLRELLRLKPTDTQNVVPLLRAIIHSDALTELVRASRTPVDDLVLRILRALIPPQ